MSIAIYKSSIWTDVSRFPFECFFRGVNGDRPVECSSGELTVFFVHVSCISESGKTRLLKMFQLALLNRVPFGKFNRASAFPVACCRELQISGAKKRRHLDDFLAINSRRQAA